MELTQLVFKTETSELEKASQALEGLLQNFDRFDSAASKAAQTKLRLAKATKAEADAALNSTKASELANKATEQSAKSENNKAEAVSRTTRAVKAQVDILQRQKDIAEFQAEGFSKGQAGILATAKAAGQLTDELKRVLELQRSLMGTDPFDKSDLGIKSLSRALKEATDAQKFFNSGMNLSIDQSRTLSRDLEKLAIKGNSVGKSLEDIKKAQAAYTKEYQETATQYNRINEAEKAIIKQRKEVVSATNYLVDADRKMAAALNITNQQLDKAGTDLLVKYETALRKSGVAQDVVTKKLGAYKAQLAQVQAQEAKRSEQHLARALSPQLTDIGVSLYSGQAPLTVLLQQGGQIADLFRLSGVEAKNFGKAMRDAFQSMIPVMATVAKGMGQFVISSMVDLGKATNRGIASIVGMNGKLDKLYIRLSNNGPSKAAASIRAFGTALTWMTTTGIVAGVAALTVLGKELYNIVRAEAELSKALVMTGARLGLTKAAAVEYARAMTSSGVTTMKAMEAIQEISKSGKIGADAIGLVTKAAIDMERYASIAVSETVKQYADLAADPVDALTTFAMKTGMVSAKVLDLVSDLDRQGKKTDAVKIAMEAMGKGMADAVEKIKQEASPMDKILFDIKEYMSDIKQSAYEIAQSDPFVWVASLPINMLQTARNVFSDMLTDITNIINNKGGLLDILMLPAEAGARLAQQDQAEKEAEKHAKALAGGQTVIGTIGDPEKGIPPLIFRSAEAFNAYKKSLDGAEESTEKFNAASAKFRASHISALDKSMSKMEQYRIKEKEINDGIVAGYITEAKAAEYLAGYKKIIFGESKEQDSYYQRVMKELTNNTIAAESATENLTKTELKLRELRKDSEFLKLSKAQQQEVESVAQVAIAKEKQVQLTEDLTKAEQFRLSVLGKEDGLGNYYKQIEALEKHAQKAGWSREQIEELTRAIYNSTPAMREYNKALEDVGKSHLQNVEASQAMQASAEKQNADIAFRTSLLGKDVEQQRILTIEYEKQNKLYEAEIAYKKEIRKINADIALAKSKGLVEEDYKSLLDDRLQLDKDYAEKVRAINADTALKYVEDLQKEFDRIRGGVSDSIVTALFEGGKAGSKKLRGFIIEELKKPVTLVVNAVVNTLMGGVMGGLSNLLGGAVGAITGGGAGGGGLLGNLGTLATLGKGISSLFGGASALGGGASIGAGIGGGIGAGIGGGAGLGVAGTATSGGFMAGMAAAMPWIGLGIGLLAAFGAFRKKKTVGAGITGELGGDEALRNYELKRKGGYLFGGPDYSINDLGEAEGSKALQDTYKAMRASTVEMAKSLGLDYKKIEDYRTQIGTQIHPDTGEQRGVDIFGLSEQEAQEKIAEALRTANNEMAQQILGTWERTTEEVTRTVQDRVGDPDNWDYVSRTITDTIETITYTASEYAREGEEAIDTLTRLATSLGTVNAVFDSLGYTLYEGSLAGADLASQLIDVFGSIENFTSATAAYYDAYYSEQEKQENLIRSVTDQLGKYNLSLPRSREEYRRLVEAQDLSTDKGREMYAMLIQLAPAFAAVTDSVQAALDAYKSQVEAAYSVLESSVDKQRELLQEQARVQQEVVNKLRSIFDLLATNVRELYGSVTSTSTMLASQGRDVISSALASGVMPDFDVLSNAISAVRNDVSNSIYATKFEQDKARLLLAADLLTLQDQTEAQLSIEELTLRGINDQIDYLDKLLIEARRQVDAALGIENAVLSVADALAALTNLLALPPTTANTNPTGFVSGPGDSGNTTRPPSTTSPFVIGGGSQDYYLEQYTRSLEWGNAKDDALSSSDLYAYAQANGFSQSDIANVLGLSEEDVRNHFDRYGIPAFAKGGLHRGGLRLVGENSPELEVTGSARYMNAPQMYDMLTQGVSSENEDLKEQVSLLRAELRANVTHTAKLVKAIERVTVGTNEGEALRTSAVV